MAGILLDVQMSDDRSECVVKRLAGSARHLIKDDEIPKFGLHPSSLSQAVGKHYGRVPGLGDVHVKKPAFHDVYNKYGWPEVHVKLNPIEAEVVSVDIKPVAMAEKVFSNDSSGKMVCKGSVFTKASTTVSRSTSNTIGISFEAGITVKGSICGVGTEMNAKFGWNSSTTSSESNMQDRTIGSENNVEVELGPGESKVAKLVVNQGTMVVKVTYRCELEGSVAVNYNPTHKGHHFWGLDVNSVLNSGGLPTSFVIEDDLEIGFYTNEKIELHDGPPAKRQKTE